MSCDSTIASARLPRAQNRANERKPTLLARVVGGGCSCGCMLRARHRQRCSGAGNGQFQSPYGGVAFDGEGNLVVCDAMVETIAFKS